WSRIMARSILILIVVSLVPLGCAGQNAQVNRIQGEKQELISTVEKERADKKALEQRAASLEARLDQSEKEIARLTGRKSNWDDGSLRSASSKSSSASTSSSAITKSPKTTTGGTKSTPPDQP